MGQDPARADPGRTSGRGMPEGLDALRGRLSAPDPGPVLPLGVADLDARLPGGLSLGPPHEIAPAEPGDGAAALGFALALCARHLDGGPGDVLIAAAGHPLPQALPNWHGLATLGLDPGRALLLEAGGDADVFRALEAALRARCLRAVVGLVAGGLPLRAGRRLQLAGEGGDPPLLLILRPAGAGLPNGAATRWRIAAAPAALDRFGCLEGPRWRAELERCRNGRGGAWILEWDRAARRLRLPERLARDAAAQGPDRGRARA
jgi:protein ImuA